jgi:hypothetical protein
MIRAEDRLPPIVLASISMADKHRKVQSKMQDVGTPLFPFGLRSARRLAQRCSSAAGYFPPTYRSCGPQRQIECVCQMVES